VPPPSQIARPLLHTVHVLTFVFLLVTGLLLFIPDLRALVVGGYSLLIKGAHRWGGVAFLVLPVMIVLRFGIGSVVLRPVRHTVRTAGQAMHFGVTVAMSVLLTVSGFVIWGKALLTESVVDASVWVHDALTYVAIILLVLHLVEVATTALLTRLGVLTE
jgi:cytochrome b subunit of formate dehydrogenase